VRSLDPLLTLSITTQSPATRIDTCARGTTSKSCEQVREGPIVRLLSAARPCRTHAARSERSSQCGEQRTLAVD
jgi:hypothetical protein